MLDQADDVLVVQVLEDSYLLPDIPEFGRLAVNLELLIDLNRQTLPIRRPLPLSQMHRPIGPPAQLIHHLILPQIIFHRLTGRILHRHLLRRLRINTVIIDDIARQPHTASHCLLDLTTTRCTFEV